MVVRSCTVVTVLEGKELEDTVQDRDKDGGSQQVRRGLEQRLLQRVLVLVVLALLCQHGHAPATTHRLR